MQIKSAFGARIIYTGQEEASMSDDTECCAAQPASLTFDGCEIIYLGPEAFEEFMSVLNAPAKVVPNLAELMRRAAPWETE